MNNAIKVVLISSFLLCSGCYLAPNDIGRKNEDNEYEHKIKSQEELIKRQQEVIKRQERELKDVERQRYYNKQLQRFDPKE